MSFDSPQRPLEQLGITPETELPENVLTPARAKSIRFTQSRPGYHYEEVEEFVAQVQSTLETYAKIFHQRDLDIHKLDEVLSRAQVDLKNKNSQLEVLVAQQGIVQSNATDDEVQTLITSNERLANELKTLRSENEKLHAEFDALNVWAAEAETYIETLKIQVEEANSDNTQFVEEHPLTSNETFDYVEVDNQPFEQAYVEPTQNVIEIEEIVEEKIYYTEPETFVQPEPERFIEPEPIQQPTQQGFKFGQQLSSDSFNYPTQDGNESAPVQPQPSQNKPQPKPVLPPGITLDDLN